jgi:signal transduction histidine kinase
MESIGRLASGIAHDFNNLLAAVLSSFDFLENCSDDQRIGDREIRGCLGEMKMATQRGVALSRQLLGFSRPEGGDKTKVAFHELCDEVVRLIRRTFPAEIKVVSEIASDLVLLGDASRLHQVLMNLCVNARDAMAEGGTLTIRAERVEFSRRQSLDLAFVSPGESVVLTVTDTGAGMDEEARRRAFEPFFTTKGKGRGSGLGLAIVYGIVRNHGGQIDLQSDVGQGTTFRIYLPALDRDGVSSKRKTLNAHDAAWSEGMPEGDTLVTALSDGDPNRTLSQPVDLPHEFTSRRRKKD